MNTVVAALLASAGMASVAAAQVTINELRIDQPSTDLDEYFELAGPAGASLDGLYLISIGDGAGGSGVVENVTDLDGLFIPADGYFLGASTTFGNAGGLEISASIDLSTTFAFENSDNLTFLLVSGFSGASGDDLDTNDDGVLDTMPWGSILDSVALLEETNVPPLATEYTYSSTTVGPDGSFVPGHVYRFPNGSGAWQIGAFGGGNDTPGTANVPAPGAAALMGLGGLLMVRRRR